MKSRLIIISDLWGYSSWIKDYTDLLESNYQMVFYDSCVLAGIDKIGLSEKEIHAQFINVGIEIAVNKLIELEQERIEVLAFSIGGLIAWKAELMGLKIHHLFAISSTRLRYEEEKPNCTIHLFYGDKDPYKPASDWFENFKLKPIVFREKEHELYKEIDCIKEICNEINTA